MALTGLSLLLGALSLTYVPSVQAPAPFNWTILSDGTRITTTEDEDGTVRRYRCREHSTGQATCLMMTSFSTFGTLYLFDTTNIPRSALKPTSGFRCQIEPYSSFSQSIYATEAGREVDVLKRQQNYPAHMFVSSGPVWTSGDITSLASNNGVGLQSYFFDCSAAYQAASRLGGIRALFTPQFPFPD
jgi:hypothetical protein